MPCCFVLFIILMAGVDKLFNSEFQLWDVIFMKAELLAKREA